MTDPEAEPATTREKIAQRLRGSHLGGWLAVFFLAMLAYRFWPVNDLSFPGLGKLAVLVVLYVAAVLLFPYAWLRQRWDAAGKLGALLVGLASAILVVLYFQNYVWVEIKRLFETPPDPTFALLIHSLILVLLIGLLRLAFLGVLRVGEISKAGAAAPPVVGQSGESFPSPTTQLVALWLLILCFGTVAGLFIALYPPKWPAWIVALFPAAGTDEAKALVQQINEALVTIFGAGIGSALSTMLAFFRHATIRRDFDRAWAPWYVARPIMGMLLGLIFYFLLRGGLWATVEADVAKAELNVWSLAGIGALVGLFSRPAIEKLRELFHTLFNVPMAAEAKSAANLRRLPEADREKVVAALSTAGKTAALFDPQAAAAHLAALPEEKKWALLSGLSAAGQKRLVNVLFPQQPSLLNQLDELPEADREALAAASPELAEARAEKSGEKAKQALQALDEAAREELRKTLSNDAKKVLAAYLAPAS